MLPPIPAPRIAQIDEVSPTRKPDDLLEDLLVPPPPEFIIPEVVQQSIFDLNKSPQDKGKKVATEPDRPVRTFKKSEGWSQERINEALEESIRIQALKNNLNLILGVSPLF